MGDRIAVAEGELGVDRGRRRPPPLAPLPTTEGGGLTTIVAGEDETAGILTGIAVGAVWTTTTDPGAAGALEALGGMCCCG